MNHHCSNSKALWLISRRFPIPNHHYEVKKRCHKYNLLLNKRKGNPLCTRVTLSRCPSIIKQCLKEKKYNLFH